MLGVLVGFAIQTHSRNLVLFSFLNSFPTPDIQPIKQLHLATYMILEKSPNS